jgi:hypothetical protein
MKSQIQLYYSDRGPVSLVVRGHSLCNKLSNNIFLATPTIHSFIPFFLYISLFTLYVQTSFVIPSAHLFPLPMN